MPLYEYECEKCGKRTERIEKFNGPHLKTCPSCGGRVSRLLSAPAIQFKGSGWYVTDYAKSSSGGSSDKQPAAGASSTAEAKADANSSSGKEAPAAKSKKKPAAKDK